MTAAQAALHGFISSVELEQAAIRVAIGGGHCRGFIAAHKPKQDQSNVEVVRPSHLGVGHATGPNTLP